jgi:hypothetical protein
MNGQRVLSWRRAGRALLRHRRNRSQKLRDQDQQQEKADPARRVRLKGCRTADHKQEKIQNETRTAGQGTAPPQPGRRSAGKADAGSEEQPRGRKQSKRALKAGRVNDWLLEIDGNTPDGPPAPQVEDDDVCRTHEPEIFSMHRHVADRGIGRHRNRTLHRSDSIVEKKLPATCIRDDQTILVDGHGDGFDELTVPGVEASGEGFRTTLPSVADDLTFSAVENEKVSVRSGPHGDRSSVGTCIGAITTDVEQRLSRRRPVAGINASDRQRLNIFSRPRKVLDAPVSGIGDEDLEPVRRINIKRFVECPGVRPATAERDHDAASGRYGRDRARTGVHHVKQRGWADGHSTRVLEVGDRFDVCFRDRRHERPLTGGRTLRRTRRGRRRTTLAKRLIREHTDQEQQSHAGRENGLSR